jgi:hypothetical protein
VQVHAGLVHEEERDAQRQRDGQRDDEAGAQAERQEAHQQHDAHRLGERAREFSHRALHRRRLVVDARQLEPHRHLGLEAADRHVERAPERDHVAARHHRHRDAEAFLAHVAHARLRRIDEAAIDRSHVGQAEEAAVGADRDRLHALDRVERPGGAHLDAVGGGLEAARGGDRVLLLQRREDFGGGHAEGRELGVGELHVDLLVLLADQVDLGHVLHPQQLVADTIGGLLQLRIAEAVAGERVDVAEGVAELVVEERPGDARWQRAAHVAHLLAHLVPGVADFLGARRVLDEHEHHRFARLRIAAQEVEARRLLQLALDAVGQLALDLLG